jgi:hypothetical protein
VQRRMLRIILQQSEIAFSQTLHRQRKSFKALSET